MEPQLHTVVALVAHLSSVIPYSLELEALRQLPERTFVVLMRLEPAVAALCGFLILGESLVARELAAIALVMAASVGATRAAAATAGPKGSPPGVPQPG